MQSGKSFKIQQILEESDYIFEKDIKQIIYISPLSPHHENEEAGAGFGNRSFYRLQQSQQHSLLGEKEAQGIRLALNGEDDGLYDREYQNSLRSICEKTGKRLYIANHLMNLKEIRNIYPRDHVLLFLDDLPCFQSLAGLNNLSSMEAHHGLISCVYSVQNPYARLHGKKCDFTTVNRNLTGRFVFNQRADLSMYTAMTTSMFPGNPGYILRCLDTAKEQLDLNYIYCDMHCRSPLPRQYQVFTAMFQSDKIPSGVPRPAFFDAFS